MYNYKLLKHENIEQVTTDAYRFYKTNGGNYLSVTTIIGMQPKPELTEWVNRVGEDEARRKSNHSAYIGDGFHKLCEAHLWGDLEKPQVNPKSIQLYKNVIPYLNNISTLYGIEIPLYSNQLKLAGTSDCLGDYEHIPSVIDFKNSRNPKELWWIKNYFMQGTFYAKMVHELYGVVLKQIVLIIANWNGTVDIYKKPVKDYYDDAIALNELYNPLKVVK